MAKKQDDAKAALPWRLLAVGRGALGTASGRHLSRFAAAGATAAMLGLALAAPGSRTVPAPEGITSSNNPFPGSTIQEPTELPPEPSWIGSDDSLALSDARTTEPEPAAGDMEPAGPGAEEPEEGAEDGDAAADDFDWKDAVAVARERTAASGEAAPTPKGGFDSWVRAARERRAESLGVGPAPERKARTNARGVQALTAFRGEVYPAGLTKHGVRRVKARKAVGQLRAAKAFAQAALGAGATEEEAAQRIHNAFDQQLFRGSRLAPSSVPGAGDSGAKGTGVRLPEGAESRAPFIAPVGAAQRRSSK